jgi:hypothetical protein
MARIGDSLSAGFVSLLHLMNRITDLHSRENVEARGFDGGIALAQVTINARK